MKLLRPACTLLVGMVASSRSWSAPPFDALGDATSHSPMLTRPFPASDAMKSGDLFVWHPVRFAAEPYFSAAVQPCHLVRLINGDQFAAEILSNRENSLELRLFGKSRIQVLLTTIDSIFPLPGDHPLINHRFGSNDSPADERLSLQVIAPGLQRLLLPKIDGDYRCWFRYRPIAAEDESMGRGMFDWRFDDGRRLQVRVDQFQEWHAEMTSPTVGSTRSQTLPARFTNRICSLQQVGERLFLTLDNDLLWAGDAPQGRLESLEFQGVDTTPNTQGGLSVEHLSLVETKPPQANRTATIHNRDAVLGTAGEIWWGELKTVGSAGVEWTDGQSMWRRSWSDLGGLQRSRASQPPPIRQLTGCVVHVELQPPADRPDVSGGRFTAVLGAGESDWLPFEHPLWGNLAVPRSAVRSLEFCFAGDWLVLAAREISWENPIDGRLTTEQASPARIEGTFELASSIADPAVFSLEQSGLEPSGPLTPPGSPTLHDLRRGNLATELLINDTLVAKLNDLTSTWSLPGEFQQLRLRLPNGILRPGQNTWKIERRTPRRSRGRNADCTLRMLSLELSPNLSVIRDK